MEEELCRVSVAEMKDHVAKGMQNIWSEMANDPRPWVDLDEAERERFRKMASFAAGLTADHCAAIVDCHDPHDEDSAAVAILALYAD